MTISVTLLLWIWALQTIATVIALVCRNATVRHLEAVIVDTRTVMAEADKAHYAKIGYIHSSWRKRLAEVSQQVGDVT